ncbi:hypothetical protein ABIE89_000403 [Bradyrhizobium niftali]
MLSAVNLVNAYAFLSSRYESSDCTEEKRVPV